MGQSSGAFHLGDDRIKRAVGVLRRAEVAQARVWLDGEAFQKRCGEPRFANTGLAGEQHHLAFTGLGPGPAPKQQFKFFFPPDEVGQAARVQCLEAAFHRTCSQRGPDTHRSGDALKLPGAEVLQLKEIAEKPSRVLGEGSWADGRLARAAVPHLLKRPHARGEDNFLLLL